MIGAIAVSSCFLPPLTCQMHSVQTAEPDESYCVVSTTTNVSWLEGEFASALARVTAGLGEVLVAHSSLLLA